MTMIKRAAKALMDLDSIQGVQEYYERRAVAALLAALDAENKELVEEFARLLHDASALQFAGPFWDQYDNERDAEAARNRFRTRARGDLKLLRSLVQGASQ